MSIEVTLDIFSARLNPNWLLSDYQEEELSRRLERFETPTLSKPAGVFGRLGYRGFILRGSGESPQGGLRLLVHEGIVDFGQSQENRTADDRELEGWLLDTAPQLEPSVRNFVALELKQPRLDSADLLSARAVPVSSCPTCHAADAPAYTPGRWNVPSVQPFNNCYNYANDQITGTFAQPGRAHGLPSPARNCPDVDSSATADGLARSTSFAAPLGAGAGWYVALVIWPGVDYHWYRQDDGGCWSHKAGKTAATDRDNGGRTITDPRHCNRGPYTTFCTYMITNRGVVIH